MFKKLRMEVYKNIIRNDGSVSGLDNLAFIGLIINIFLLISASIYFAFDPKDEPSYNLYHFWSGVTIGICAIHAVFFVCYIKLFDDIMHNYNCAYENLDRKGKDSVCLVTIYFIITLLTTPVLYIYLALKLVVYIIANTCSFVFMTGPKALISLFKDKEDRQSTEAELISKFDRILKKGN